MELTVFVLIRALPAWLALSRIERRAVWEGELGRILQQYPAVTLRTFDAEAFSSRCSDIVMFKTADLKEYYFLTEMLRDSSIYSVPYFELIDIIPSVEGGFEEYDRAVGASTDKS